MTNGRAGELARDESSMYTPDEAEANAERDPERTEQKIEEKGRRIEITEKG